MSPTPATTASLRPQLFSNPGIDFPNRATLYVLLGLVLLIGFSFRSFQLGAEGLSEDELNKLHAVQDYRARGLTSANSEHPMLMKALLTVSVVAVERWNETTFAKQHPAVWRIETEAALRLPVILFGALTSLLVFYVTAELFGDWTGLIAAALWAVDPAAIGFNRIAKEDSFYVFFFLLANFFWLRSQRRAETGASPPEPLYWATAAAFGAMLASKYLPHMLAVSAGYNKIFQGIPETRWRIGIRRWMIFVAVMGAVFLVCNPTILLPATWHEMRIFAGERRIGHDSYEFMNTLYRNQLSLWLQGVPWHFYFVFLLVKLPVLTVVGFLIGLPCLLLRRRLGDGRYFVFFWLFFWFFPFTLLGGKFTRYFTVALPAVLITAAIGIQVASQISAAYLSRFALAARTNFYIQIGVAITVFASASVGAQSVAPHYRLYVNALGGGAMKAGSYFPHDEFYDSSVRDAALAVSRRARPGARVASEAPGLFAHYARLAGRPDLISVSLSNKLAVSELTTGDFILAARGRRYFSNRQILGQLETARPSVTLMLGGVESMRIYELDSDLLAPIHRALVEKVVQREPTSLASQHT